MAQIMINCLITSSLYALAGLSFVLIYRVTKFFNLAHGVVITIGGYAMYVFYQLLNLPLCLSAVIAVIVAGLVGFLFERFFFRALRRKKSPATIFLLASTGLMVAVQSIIAIFFSSQFKNLSNLQNKQLTFNIFGGVINLTQVLIIFFLLLIMLSVFFIFRFTNFGKIIRAISDNYDLAKSSGINVDFYISCMFFIGSAIAGWLGILIGFDTGLEPTVGTSILLKGIISMIVGGVNNIFGVVLGAALLGFTENTGAWVLTGEFKDLIAFTILVIFILIRPQGLIKK